MTLYIPDVTFAFEVNGRRFASGWLLLRSSFLVALAILLVSPPPARAVPDKKPDVPCRIQVLGFSGGLALPRFMTVSSFEGIARSVRELGHPDVCVRSFPVLHSGKAHRWVRGNFPPRTGDRLTDEELARGPRVILYGYSVGAKSALALARKLAKEGIPVELALLIDSTGRGEAVVPRNVRVAVHFYQKKTWLWPFRSDPKIRADDESDTIFLGNRRLDVGHFSIAGHPDVIDLLLSSITQLRASSAFASLPPTAP